jgi:hypothetical protein
MCFTVSIPFSRRNQYNRGSQYGLPDPDAERLVPMARSDWLTPRGTDAHQGVFISSKKVPYGVGLTLMSRPRTDGGSFLPPPHIFRGSFLFFRHSHFDQCRQLTAPAGPTGRPLSKGVSPCRTSTVVVQRHVGLGQIERESEAHACLRGRTNGEEARTVGPCQVNPA